MKPIAYKGHLVIRCKGCNRLRRADKVSKDGYCVACIGEAILKQSKQTALNAYLEGEERVGAIEELDLPNSERV